MIKSGCTCTGLFVYGYRGFFCSAESSARDSAGKSFPRRLFPRSVSRIGTQHVNKATRGRCGNGNGSPVKQISRTLFLAVSPASGLSMSTKLPGDAAAIEMNLP
jgi:hypothetical protein